MNEYLICLIAWRVLASDLLDYVRFRVVFPHWQSSTVCPHNRGVIDPRFHPLYPSHASLQGYIRFFNLDTGKFVRVKLPVFNDHCVLNSAEGLLVMHRDENTAIRLFHPFTGDVVDLPPLMTLVPHINPDLPGAFHPTQKFHYLRGVCAAFSVSATGVITTMLALHRMSCVAFATPRDQRWCKLPYSTPLSFQGKLYIARKSFGAAENLDIFQVDPSQEDHVGSALPPPKLIATISTDKLTRPLWLVECDSQILHMLVYRLADLTLEKLIPIRSIGDKALFLNNERSLSVSSNGELPTVVSSTIVQTSPKNGSLTYGLIFFSIFRNKGHLYNRKKGCKWQVKGKWRLGKGA
ncbi:hypothetical protein VPH35_066201 [Triticum aestivum]